MSSTFKFHSQVNETVPWQAQYTFPTQSTKIQKQTVKLPPKNGSTFTAGNIMRIEFPADGYLNALNSFLQFDLRTTYTGTATTGAKLGRQGAHSAIKRLRILYGSLVLEDIQEYATLVRIFTELGVQRDYLNTFGTVLDGMYDSHPDGAQLTGYAIVGTPVVRTQQYCLNLMSGLLTCKKLIPLKWMAAQLALEITFATDQETYITNPASNNATFQIQNVNFVAEMLEFDSTYDSAFYAGLTNGGVPLKFATWNFHTFAISGSTISAQIHERSRSIKSGFAVIRQNTVTSVTDSYLFFNSIGSSAVDMPATGTGYTSDISVNAQAGDIVTEYQWRVGGKYYPAQPVNCVNGGGEALCELLQTIDSLGDYRVAGSVRFDNFAPTTGRGDRFIIGQEFENTDVSPDSIAGINGEEQSDINLTIKCNGAANLSTGGGKKLDVFMLHDALLIIRDGNVVDLVM